MLQIPWSPYAVEPASYRTKSFRVRAVPVANTKVHPRKGRAGRSTDLDGYPSELSTCTLRAPDRIKISAASHGPGRGGLCRASRYICLVVKRETGYSFILTAYLDRRIKGEQP